MSTSYQKLSVKATPKSSSITGENRYWGNFSNPLTSKQHNKITDIEFCPLKPYDFAVTTSTRVLLYDSLTGAVRRTISRFSEVAYSATWRKDGKLVVAGSDDHHIRVFDANSRVVLRNMKGHTASVKVCRFFEHEPRYIYSGSDDRTVRIWDMTTEALVDTYTQHTDYVRCLTELNDTILSNSPSSIVVSASYDHSIHVWDRRVGGSSFTPVYILNHQAPVEDVLVIPETNMICSAGENFIQVWDLAATQTSTSSSSSSSSSSSTSSSSHSLAPIQTISNHQKTITSLCWDPSTSRLMSGGLDHLVKVYSTTPSSMADQSLESSTSLASSSSTSSWSVTHTMKFPSAILSVAISPDSRVLAVGGADGTLTIRSRSAFADASLSSRGDEPIISTVPDRSASRLLPRHGSARWYNRGATTAAAEDDLVVFSSTQRAQKLQPYDIFFKKFEYHQALDAALLTKKPSIICTVLDELYQRGSLCLITALKDRDEVHLLPLLSFCCSYIIHPYYSTLLLYISHLLLDLYSHVLGHSVQIDELWMKLKDKLKEEINNQKNLTMLQGTLEVFLHQLNNKNKQKRKRDSTHQEENKQDTKDEQGEQDDDEEEQDAEEEEGQTVQPGAADESSDEDDEGQVSSDESESSDEPVPPPTKKKTNKK